MAWSAANASCAVIFILPLRVILIIGGGYYVVIFLSTKHVEP